MSSVPKYIGGHLPPTPDDQILVGIITQLCVQDASSLECETLEIKNWCCDEKELSQKISEAAMCLANKSGGLVLVGIEDKGSNKFSRLPYPNIRIDWIYQRIYDNTVPSVEISVRDITELLQKVVGSTSVNAFAIRIQKSKRPGGHQMKSGLAKIREGNKCNPYYLTEDDRTKAPIPAAAPSELSLTSIEWALERHAKNFDVPKQKWESPYDFLAEIGVLERYLPDEEQILSFRLTLAAVLLFGSKSAIRQHVPSFETILLTPYNQKHFRANIIESYKELCGSKNSLLCSLCPNIPHETIEELVVNAFIHRSYRVSAPIVIRVAEERLEIESPGGLPGQLTPDALIHCTPVYRNFLLAEGARYLGLCDKVGKGIDRVYKNVLSKGFEFPTFESSDSQFLARVPLKESREFREYLKKRSQFLATLDEIIVFRFLFDREKATASELRAAMQRGPDFSQEILAEMFRKLMIEPIDGSHSFWHLTPTVRADITNIFKSDQIAFEFTNLFGEN